MAVKRFAGVKGGVESEEVSRDYEAAEQFDKLRVGALGVYFREGLRTRYLSYADFDRAFIRIQEVNGRMCCGKAVFSYFRMVFVKDGREFADVLTEDEKALDAALARIHERSPETAIGVAEKKDA